MRERLRFVSRYSANLLLLATSSALACASSGGSDASEISDADIPLGDACAAYASEDAPIPIESVCFEDSVRPGAAAQTLENWFTGACNRPSSDLQSSLDCPSLRDSFKCRNVQTLGSTGSWLDGRTEALICQSCQPNAQGLPCECTDGLDKHSIGLGGILCDYLLLIDDGQAIAIRNREDFINRFAPVDDAGEALAFVELLGVSVKHLFARYDFLWAGSSVPGYPVTYESTCVAGNMQGTFVESNGGNFIVHTYQVPDLDGCSFDALTQVTYMVTPGGEVSLIASHPVCHAQIPCYD